MNKNVTIFILSLTAVILAWLWLTHQIPSPIVSVSKHVPDEKKIEDFTLWDQEGVAHNLYYYSDQRAIVIFIYAIGCPIARNSLSAVKQAHERFGSEGVQFFILDASTQDNRDALKKEAEEFGIDFPILMDDSQMISKNLGVIQTAEVMVIDPKKWEMVYRGAVEDRGDVTASQEQAKNRYLWQALEAFLEEKDVVIKQTPVKGSLVNYLQGSISYAQDIVPILEKHCVICHNSQGIGPWAMTDYQKVKGWAAMMREVVRTNRMPPRQPDPYYGAVKDVAVFTAENKRMLLTWLEAGAPLETSLQQDPLTAIERLAAKKEYEWPFGEPDMVITSQMLERAPSIVFVESMKIGDGANHIPSTGVLEFVFNFTVKHMDREKWVRAVAYRPSNKKVVHHSSIWNRVRDPIRQKVTTGMIANTLEKVAMADALRRANQPIPDELKMRPEGIEEMLQGYEPGMMDRPFPKGTGKFIPQGNNRFLFITHYLTTGKPEHERPEVGLYFYKEEDLPIKPLRHFNIQNNIFEIPPGEKHYEIVTEQRFDSDIILYAAAPHMHYQGKSMKMVARYPGGEERIFMSVPDFDYDYNVWYYWFEEPKYLPAGSTLVLKQVFDNSAQNSKNPYPTQRVIYGYQRLQAMNQSFILYVEVESKQEAQELLKKQGYKVPTF